MTDYQTKIQEYSFEELCQAIMADAASRDMLSCRYAARFVMLDNFDTFRSLREFLSGIGVKLLQFDKLLETDHDDWITPDQMRHEMQQCVEATLVTPFSELVRFYDEQKFCGFMHDISLMEDTAHPTKRIYIPLVGLERRMMDFLKGFSRIKESAPIWSCHTGKQETKVFLMEHSTLPADSHITVLHSAYEWLQYWKTSAPQRVVICTSIPIRAFHGYSQPDNIFSFAEIENTYQLLTQMLGYSFPFSYSKDDDAQWEQMATEVLNIPPQDFKYTDYVCQRAKMYDIRVADFLRLWTDAATSDFDRWLLKKYATSNVSFASQKYLLQCLAQSDLSADGLLVAIATQIPLGCIGQKPDATLLAERTALMQMVGELMRTAISAAQQDELQRQIVVAFQKGDVATAKALCTHTFDFERRLAAGWFDLHERDSFTRKDLAALYPDMAAYLGEEGVPPPDGCGWMHDYFKHYRRAKLADKYTAPIAEAIKTHNGSNGSFYQWYHATPRCHDLMNQAAADCVYWVDGLGAEYIPYLQYLLVQQKVFAVQQCCYARADLPSSTAHNRYDLPPERIFRQLDEKAHDPHGYRQYDTLIEELSLLREVVDTIISNHRHQLCRIAIVSDHGLSCLSRLTESLKHNKDAEHEGRFLQSDSPAAPDTDFLYHIGESDGKQYKVALRHASLGIKPTHEVHGGCTPEEVLVPFVLLVPREDVVDYTISLQQNKIPITNPTIGIYIAPTPMSVLLAVEGATYQMQHRGGALWEATLLNPKAGIAHLFVQPDRGEEWSAEVEVYGMGFNNKNVIDF